MLIGRSRGIVAIHPRDGRPGTEMVLWLGDGSTRGEPGIDEVAVLAHSEVLQAITLFLPPDPADDEDPLDEPAARWSDMTDPEFCEWWRDRPGVTRRRLATAVASMDVEPVGGDRGRSGLHWMRLTWAPDSVDGPDEASVLLESGGEWRHSVEE